MNRRYCPCGAGFGVLRLEQSGALLVARMNADSATWEAAGATTDEERVNHRGPAAGSRRR